MTKDSLYPEDFARRTAVGFIVVIWILAPYALLQKFAISEVWMLEEQRWDKLIPVQLNAVYIYVSYIFLLALAGYYTTPRSFVRFLKSICLVALVSHLTFFFIPSGLVRPNPAELALPEIPKLYSWVIKLDEPRNCLPSLHASLAALAACALWKRHWLLGIFATSWAAAIYWSAIALRQHICLDLAAGLILALTVWFGVRRWAVLDEL